MCQKIIFNMIIVFAFVGGYIHITNAQQIIGSKTSLSDDKSKEEYSGPQIPDNSLRW